MITAAAAGQPVLELTGIGKDFGAIRALHGIDMRVSPGEVVGLMGDNGAGKSTLVKIIAGNFPANHGEIRFEGNAVHFYRPIDARAGVPIGCRSPRKRSPYCAPKHSLPPRVPRGIAIIAIFATFGFDF